MECREKCAACCIAPSISSSIPLMPEGKPANVACLHLTSDLKCGIFDSPDRPDVCGAFIPEKEICGNSRDEALQILESLEE